MNEQQAEVVTLPDGRRLRVTPLSMGEPVQMPSEYDPRRLARRGVPVLALIALLVLIVLLTPGLGEVRDRLVEASPPWLAVAVLLEALSCASYVVMFRYIFCRHIPWRTSWEIGLSELAVGSIVPASGASGLALGAWILRKGGMSADHIARRSVAFFVIKSSVNFVAVAVLGVVMALGLAGPDLSLWLTALPAGMAILVIVLVLWIPRLGPGPGPRHNAGKVRRAVASARKAVVHGVGEAREVIGSREWPVIVGSIGYWAFDNAVLWATFQAFGSSPALLVILLGYLIGQLGGLLPIPGGIGSIDGGLIGTLIVYGTPAATTAAAVLAYRVILFWLPLIVGSLAFASLRRALNNPDRPELCAVPAAT